MSDFYTQNEKLVGEETSLNVIRDCMPVICFIGSTWNGKKEDNKRTTGGEDS
jgi:hypothetical protein